MFIIIGAALRTDDLGYVRQFKRGSVERKRRTRKCVRYQILSMIVSLISLMGIMFIPNRDDMITIIVGSKAIDFVQSDSSLNKLPAQTTKFISDYLDKQLKEIKDK